MSSIGCQRRLPGYKDLREALRERAGERNAYPFMRMTIQCTCGGLSCKGHTEPDRNPTQEGPPTRVG